MTEDQQITVEKRVTHFFTFGYAHMTSLPLPRGGILADYWVEVDLPYQMDGYHRTTFVNLFTSDYCPRPAQWSMEYAADRFNRDYFPRGLLCLITEKGLFTT